MRIGDRTLNPTDTHKLRLMAVSLFGSALSTCHSLISDIVRLAVPAVSAARAFPIVAAIIDIPMQFYDAALGLKQWWKSDKRTLAGLYQVTIGFLIDSLINASTLGAVIAPLAFALASPILLIAGFGIATLYFANELKNNIKQYLSAKKSSNESEQKSAKRKMLANGGFMVGSMALTGAVAAVTFSPIGTTAAVAFAGVFIGIALYRLIIKLVRPVTIEVSPSKNTPSNEDAPLELTEKAAPAVVTSASSVKMELPAAAVIAAGLGVDVSKSCCYKA